MTLCNNSLSCEEGQKVQALAGWVSQGHIDEDSEVRYGQWKAWQIDFV
jgi:hypothetical protein